MIQEKKKREEQRIQELARIKLQAEQKAVLHEYFFVKLKKNLHERFSSLGLIQERDMIKVSLTLMIVIFFLILSKL